MIIARTIGLADYIPLGVAWIGFLISVCLLIGLALGGFRTSFIRKWRIPFAVSTIIGGFGLFWHTERESAIADSFRRMRASRDMKIIEFFSYHYFFDKRAWPQGDNAAVIAALLQFHEDNRYQRDGGLRLSPEGSAIDPWGTPYRMNFSETEGFRFHSAGPDRTWDTDDDLRRQGIQPVESRGE